jgi:hypothetical protein
MEFEARAETRPILGGLGNLDRYWGLRDGKVFEGATLRLYDPAKDEWAIYYADDIRPGDLQPPVRGRFRDGVGEFSSDEEFEGKKIICRYRWFKDADGSPRWERPSRLIAERAGKPTGS